MERGYAQRFWGSFQGMLHWPQLDALWSAVRAQPQNWFLVEANQALPEAPLPGPSLLARLNEIDALLRKEHQHSYCGIVYADDANAPSLIKIFDPRGLGSMCSCSTEPTPPRWVLSRWRPETLPSTSTSPSRRKPWWKLR